jgi:hypothetical protein
MQKRPDYERYLAELFALLDKYLVSDLETLINEIPARPQGGVGYPALHTMLSSMELLGLILSGQTDDGAFTAYWDHLCKRFPQYKDGRLVDIFREVMRNGTAHLFLVKAGVSVSKDGSYHLAPRRVQGHIYLNVDLKTLHTHFLETYHDIKSTVSTTPVTAAIRRGCEVLRGQMNDARKKVDRFLEAGPLLEVLVSDSSHVETMITTSTTSVTTSGNNQLTSL